MIITVEELQKYTGVYDGDLQESYCQAATEIVNNYLHYATESAKYVHYFSGQGRNYIQLRGKPITEITAVAIDGVDCDVSQFDVDGEHLYFRGGMFQLGDRNVRVSYTAGYTADTMPEVIKGAALQIAAVRQLEADQNVGINSKQFGDSGTRIFLQTRKYDDFLRHISAYRII